MRVAYALGSIHVILDVIPVISYLDDLILVLLGVMLVLRLIPSIILTKCRENAEAATNQNTPKSPIVAIVVVVIWVLLGILAVVWIGRRLQLISMCLVQYTSS